MTLTVAQAFLGVVLAIMTIASVVFAAGRFVEKASGNVTSELKHMNKTLEDIKEDLTSFKGYASQALQDHGERLARIEGRDG